MVLVAPRLALFTAIIASSQPCSLKLWTAPISLLHQGEHPRGLAGPEVAALCGAGHLNLQLHYIAPLDSVNPLGHEVRELSELRAFDEVVWDGGRLLDRWGAASWLDGCCFARLLHTSLPTCAFLEPLGFAGLRSSWQSLHLTHCFFSSSSPTDTSRTSKCSVGRDFFFSFWYSSDGSSGGPDKYLPSSFSRFKVGLVLFISRVRLWGNERKLKAGGRL